MPRPIHSTWNDGFTKKVIRDGDKEKKVAFCLQCKKLLSNTATIDLLFTAVFAILVLLYHSETLRL